MNDYFAVEPAAYEDWRELKMILEQFGPYHGRYIADFPAAWESLIRSGYADWPEIKKARAKLILENLIKRKGLIRNLGLPYDKTKSWKDNVASTNLKVRPKPFKGAVVSAGPASDFFTAAEDFSLPPTADELIDATPEEYARVSEAILKFSELVILIDPYLDICKKDRNCVIESLLKKTEKSRCKEFKIFARSEQVLRSDKEIRDATFSLLKYSRGSVEKITYNLCDDKSSAAPMHARYLLSYHGGIRLDQGFQRLNRKVDVTVVGESIKDSLWEDFSKDSAPFPISKTIEVCL